MLQLFLPCMGSTVTSKDKGRVKYQHTTKNVRVLLGIGLASWCFVLQLTTIFWFESEKYKVNLWSRIRAWSEG